LKAVFYFRKAHKWLALLIGLQILLWGLSGLYMTIIHIDTIHGDHLVNMPSVDNSGQINSDAIKVLPESLLRDYQTIQSIQLSYINQLQQTVYKIKYSQGVIYIDAQSLRPLEPLNKADITKMANQIYAGQAAIENVELLKVSPQEIGAAKQAVWRVSYNDWLNSTLYFSAESGALLKKRSDLWRLFDVMWMLHIMDYETRQSIDGKLFRISSIMAIVFSLCGFILLFYTLRKPQSIKVKGKTDVGVSS
jgi:uncharacterized iron-regulated membrane protein